MSIEKKHRICLGADGCKDGWIVAVLDGDLRIERFSSISKIIEKYPEFSEYRALLSMTYFDDAEMQDMPLMFIKTPWESMKTSIIQAVEAYQK